MRLPRISVAVEAPPTCTRCGKPVSLLGTITYNKQTGRCGGCERQTSQALAQFRQAFIAACADGLLSEDEWKTLWQRTQQAGVAWEEALVEVRGDALQFLERTLTFVSSDGMITADEAKGILYLQQSLQVPDAVAAPMLQRLAYMQHITRIRQGDLPLVQTSAHLAADERCYLDTSATYRKVLAKSISEISGRLIATNKQILFTSPTEGWNVKLKNISEVGYEPGAITLNLSVKKGAGRYAVSDAYAAEAIITALIRLDNRLMLAPQAEGANRHIPQDVKSAVWQRDAGKCVQCGESSYLEFDHIIPWSKGGASTAGNVQLLCRRCNLQKSDRI